MAHPPSPALTPLAASLPLTVPFVGPEAMTRARGRPFSTRIGANESGFGPAASVVEAMRAVPGVIAASGHSSHAYRSGANLYFTVAAQPQDPSQFESTYDAYWNAARSAVANLGVGVAHHHGIGRVRRGWMTSEVGQAGVDVLRALKRALDPDGLMNPGVLVP